MTMLKNKHITFSLMLMCLIVVSPMVKAQLGSLLGAPNVINIQGLVLCASGTISGNNAPSIPPFPNATVQLQCGRQILSSTTTNAVGVFSIATTTLPVNLSTLLSPNCKVVVTTPLSTCNVSLPAGSFTLPLSIVGITVSHGCIIANLFASIFRQ